MYVVAKKRERRNELSPLDSRTLPGTLRLSQAVAGSGGLPLPLEAPRAGFGRPRDPPSTRREGVFADIPALVDPQLARGAGEARHRATLLAPGRGLRPDSRPASTSSSSPRPPAARRSATTCRCSICCCGDPGARAMYLFPTKALAEDQLHEFQRAVEEMGSDIRAFTYDGDTPQDARKAIRQRANVVLTNPDMLHSRHPAAPHPVGAAISRTCATSSSTSCTTIAASTAAIWRICCAACSASASSTVRKPQFICCSATIANPRELAEALTGEPFELVERNGAPRGEKYFIFYNPPVVNRQLGIRRSYIARNPPHGAEVHRAQPADAGLRQQPPGHRGPGHLSEGRLRPRPACPARPCAAIAAAICRANGARSSAELRDGEIRAVVATNALELGIDIGSLDAVVMAGYPGTIASSWQRAGRAGRRQGTSAAVLVASQRAARSVHRRASRLLLRPLAGACLHQCGQPGDPAGAPEVRRLRAAHPRRRKVRPARHRRAVPLPGRDRLPAPLRRRLALDQRHLSRRRHQPALRHQRQFRGGGYHRRAQSDRRGFLPHRAHHAAREGHLPARSAPVSRGALRLRRAQGLREAAWIATTTPTPSTTRRSRCCEEFESDGR